MRVSQNDMFPQKHFLSQSDFFESGETKIKIKLIRKIAKKDESFTFVFKFLSHFNEPSTFSAFQENR